MQDKLNLRGTDLLVYALFYSFHCANRHCRLTYGYIAKRIHISERQAINAVNSLLEKRLVFKEVCGKGIDVTINTIKLFPDPEEEGVKKFHPGGENFSPNNKNRNNNKLNNLQENARAREENSAEVKKHKRRKTFFKEEEGEKMTQEEWEAELKETLDFYKKEENKDE